MRRGGSPIGARHGKLIGDRVAQIGDGKAADEAIEGDDMAHFAFADLAAACQLGQAAQFAAGDLAGGVEAAQGECCLRAAVERDDAGHDQVQRIAELGLREAAVEIRVRILYRDRRFARCSGAEFAGGLQCRIHQCAAFLDIGQIGQLSRAQFVKQIAAARRA